MLFSKSIAAIAHSDVVMDIAALLPLPVRAGFFYVLHGQTIQEVFSRLAEGEKVLAVQWKHIFGGDPASDIKGAVGMLRDGSHKGSRSLVETHRQLMADARKVIEDVTAKFSAGTEPEFAARLQALRGDFEALKFDTLQSPR